MNSDHFNKPVRFLLDAGHWIEVCGVTEALAFMRTRWPDEGGDLYEHALDVCQKAMSDLKSVEAARFAFVDALSDAGFLIVRDFEHLHMLADQFGILRPQSYD
ncbi:DUF982 domain-containing protein [Labrys neptuniae]|uniref:DUF982 domain-containing protein n=1 Tax=Labrys neptuniae TaxID=376174 RepID=A0ABV3PWM1_9HYPH